MEVAGLLMGLTGPLQQLVQVAEQLKNRFSAYRANPAAAQALLQTYHRMLLDLESLSLNSEGTIAQFPENHAAVLKNEVDELNCYFTTTLATLREKVQKLESRSYQVTHAIRTETQFSQLSDKARLAQESIRRISAILASVSVMERNTAVILDRLDDAASRNEGSQKDIFRANNTVPNNPPRVFLDFLSTSNNKPATFEGKLKAAVLNSTSYSCFGAVATGMSGVGKTCAMRALGNEPDIIKRFPGGVYFVSLGRDATVRKIMQQLCGIVDASGGKRLAVELRNESEFDIVLTKVRDWFGDKVCLFQFDGIWKTNGITSGTLLQLSALTGTHGRSRLVYTTRDRTIGVQGETVHFEPCDPKSRASKNILMRAAGLRIDQDVDPSNRRALDGILEICAGLPVALAVAGSGVRIFRNSCRGHPEESWNEYWCVLKAQRTNLLNTSTGSYEPLTAALRVSVDLLEPTISVSHPMSLSYREMHRALCVLQKQSWVPVCVLRRLWGLRDESLACEVVRKMANANVADAERRTQGGVVTLGLRLHDLVHDFAQAEAAKHGDTTEWHRNLLEDYLPERREPLWWHEMVLGDGMAHSRVRSLIGNALYVVQAVQEAVRHHTRTVLRNKFPVDPKQGWCREWWSENVPNDGYIHRNVCRHLKDAGRSKELLYLLWNPHWCVKQMANNGILQLEEDFTVASEWFNSNTAVGNVQCDRDAVRSLAMIAKAARLSVGYASRNETEVWFQLYARLLLPAADCDMVRGFLFEVERCAPRPWLKPMNPCLTGPGGALLETIFLQWAVYFTSVDEMGRVVSCGSPDMGRSYWVARHSHGREVETVALKWSPPGIPAAPHSGTGSDSETGTSEMEEQNVIACAAISKDGAVVATGTRDSTVLIWDANTGEQIGNPLCHSDTVWCVAMSADGKRLVSGANDGTVRVWDTQTGEQLGSPLTTHRSSISCVAMSADGKRLASGSADETIRLWDAETNQQMHGPLTGHTGFVTCLALSADGKTLVSGSTDTTVRIWNTDNGRQIGNPLIGHADWVGCVSINADGSRVVSGSDDRTVRVWDPSTGASEQLDSPLTGHIGLLWCVAISAEGHRVVSSSEDRTLRIWDVDKVKQEDKAILGHTDRVRCFAVSEDGKVVVSGSDDKSVRIWDAETGKQIGDALTGHTRPVRSVGLSADRRVIVSCSEDRTVRLWNAVTGEQKGSPLTGHLGIVRCVAVSGNGKRVVSGSDDETVRVWDAELGEQEGPPLVGHSRVVRCLAISPDGSLAVSGSADGSIRIWDIEKCEQRGWPLTGHFDHVRCIALSGDGNRVVSQSRSGAVRLWDLSTMSCLRQDETISWYEACGRYLHGDNDRSTIEGMGFRQEKDSSIVHYGQDFSDVLVTFEAPISVMEISRCSNTIAVGFLSGLVTILKIET